MPNAINCVRLCATIKWGLFLWSQKNVTLDLCILIWNQMISLCLNRTEANSLKLRKWLCLSKLPRRLKSLRKANTLFELGNPNVGNLPARHGDWKGKFQHPTERQDCERSVTGNHRETAEARGREFSQMICLLRHQRWPCIQVTDRHWITRSWRKERWMSTVYHI